MGRMVIVKSPVKNVSCLSLRLLLLILTTTSLIKPQEYARAKEKYKLEHQKTISQKKIEQLINKIKSEEYYSRSVINILLSDRTILSKSDAKSYRDYIYSGSETNWIMHKNYNNTKFEVYPGVQTLVTIQSKLGQKIEESIRNTKILEKKYRELNNKTEEEAMDTNIKENVQEEINDLKASLSALNSLDDIFLENKVFQESSEAENLQQNIQVSKAILEVTENLLEDTDANEADTNRIKIKSDVFDLIDFSAKVLEKGLKETVKFLVSEEHEAETENLNITMLKKSEDLKDYEVEESLQELKKIYEEAEEEEEKRKMVDELEELHEEAGIPYVPQEKTQEDLIEGRYL